MKTKLFSLLIFCFSFWSCQERKEEKVEKEIAPPPSSLYSSQEEEIIPKKECYLYSNNKDTVNLGIEIRDNQVTGYLMYHLAEKDMNNGHLIGEMRGDTLYAEYFFRSEGKESVRDVAFLKMEKKLIEGHGEMKQTEEGEKFIEAQELSFGDGLVLERTNCGVD